MTTTKQHRQLIGKLLAKTHHDEVSWHAAQDFLELPLSELLVRIGKRAGEVAPADYFLELRNENNILLDSIDSDDQLAELYSSALQSVGRSAIDRAIKVLDEEETVFMPPKIVLPPKPTAEDERRLFEAIQGIWHLNFGRGMEVVNISDNGVYSCGNVMDNVKPKYQLKLIAQNLDTNKFEIAKDFLDGRRMQIEVLRLDNPSNPNRMVGEAQHDRHKLLYSRNPA